MASQLVEPVEGGILALAAGVLMLLAIACANVANLLLVRLNHECRSAALCTALNFGPDQDADRSVEDLVGELLRHWPGEWSDLSRPDHRHEASRLALTSEKAGRLLGWQGRWDFATSVECTAEWYRAFYEQRDRASLRALTQSQIERYERALS